MKILKKAVCFILALSVVFAAGGCSHLNKVKIDEETLQAVSKMKIGWNLGNTLDTFDGEGLDTEIAWGNPKTTEKMILDIKEAGFDTIRIPVTWSKHIDGDNNIDKDWLARVKEVVDYAYGNGMFVVLNSHHDNELYKIGESAQSEEVKKESIETMKTLWTQIAAEFKDYDEKLLFETLNEPRAVGSELEWMGGTSEEREVVYELNREIVSAIRASGGNNEKRFILVPSYAATSDISILKEMELPEDGRIIVSIHAYAPYDFAMNIDGGTDFTQDDKKELDKLFKNIDKLFLKKGIPVIIGEFGVTNKGNIEDRCEWAGYYTALAESYNIPCMVWDNGYNEVGAENYGLYDRQNGVWFSQELTDAYTRGFAQSEQ